MFLNRCIVWSHLISWTVEQVWEVASLVSLIDIWIHHCSYVIIHIINIYIYMYKIQLIVNSWDCQIYFHRYKPTFAAVLRAQGLQKVHCTDCTCPSVEWGTWFQESHPHFKTVPKKHFRCYTSCFSGRMLWEHLSFQLFSEKMNHSIQQKAEAYGQAENSTVGPSVNPPPVSWAHSLKIFEEV